MVHSSNIKEIKMSLPGYVTKTLRMKPEVEKIFDDLDAWLDYCRFNMLPFNPADMYKSQEYRYFSRKQNGGEFKPRYDNKYKKYR
jgi:hypothetical protein